ncbi:Tannase and feruloyl esterase [Marinomonas spartinae]|uniref:Tannase and feruloyl esterase n=1 Tax=Marinomonas spartinae TaxID=1792290 RepID=A0A1A8T8B5_9GAMM|nr:tannase/feruloyl esterase family alpha/beta hydrolase [Marinomonas spartinae]SBS27743.1 Tannase and feruloyl esterase [Marinomonas spartinae]SBS30154.1 Tannase and feruloyl esterase [Marinomonas spartinae]
MNKAWLFCLALPMVAKAGVMACDPSTFHAPGLTIKSAQWQSPAGDVLVENCRVEGVLDPYEGMDGRAYGIGFELRLPKNWHHDFAYQFNGGNDGIVKAALGGVSSLIPSQYALNRGMAVVSSNGGHDQGQFTDMGLAGSSGFGWDAKARSLYGYEAVAKLGPVAKKLVTEFYGSKPEYSYGIGVSNGGRMAMVSASRFPTMFDGILVGFPGFNLPKAAIQHAWDIQHFHAVNSDLKQSLTPKDLSLVSHYILKQCDDLDGLKDGLIFNAKQCQKYVNLQDLVCHAGQKDCLSQSKVNALVAMHNGPHNSQGKALYSRWYYDAGIDSSSWRAWKIESPVPAWGYNSIIATMGASSLAQIFTTPPTKVEGTPDGLVQYLLSFNFDTDAAKIYAKTKAFPESSMDFMTPPDVANPTMSAFKKAGGKMIIFHGNSDPVFSALDTINWYNKLNQNQNGKARDFVTFYEVPGMPHGQGGPSLDQFDVLSPLVAWVEKGQSPSRVISQARANNPEVSKPLLKAKRPLCPYPTMAVYEGGNQMSASSFICH